MRVYSDLCVLRRARLCGSETGGEKCAFMSLLCVSRPLSEQDGTGRPDHRSQVEARYHALSGHSSTWQLPPRGVVMQDGCDRAVIGERFAPERPSSPSRSRRYWKVGSSACTLKADRFFSRSLWTSQ